LGLDCKYSSLKTIVKYKKDKNNDYYIVAEQRDNNLGIFDRFIRTLGDWMRKNKPITYSNIHKFLKTCNKNLYQTTRLSPGQLQDNKDIEIQYIIESPNEQNKNLSTELQTDC
jgi:hypothetical protein